MATATSVPMATAATAGSLGRGRVAVPGPVRVPRTTTDGRDAATGASADVANRNRRAALVRGAIQASTTRPAQIAVNPAKSGPPPHGARPAALTRPDKQPTPGRCRPPSSSPDMRPRCSKRTLDFTGDAAHPPGSTHLEGDPPGSP